MNNHNADVIVIGSGPGGYVAAIRAAQLGLNTICIERSELGGICLNWGCIPTKALLKSAEMINHFKEAETYGLDAVNTSFDIKKIVERSRKVADKMSRGIQFLFKKYNVKLVVGNGSIKSPTQVEVHDKDGNLTDIINAKNIIIATGARPRMFPGIEVDRKGIITSREAMIPDRVPESIIIMGAGAIGVEFAYFYNSIGSKVTIIEMMDRILPIEDEEISKELARIYRKYGVTLLTKTKVISATTQDKSVEVKVQKDDGTETPLTGEIALNAIGIQANTENIGLENIGIEMQKGFIKVNNHLQTNIPNVYAIGDVAGAPWLAHKASAEGIEAAEFIAGHNTKGIDYNNIPGNTYCIPQVASVGLTEAKAKEQGYAVKIGKFPFSASGKATAIGETNGFVKVIIDEKNGNILGVHMIGPDVTELIGEATLARSVGATGK
ncbi:MAG TPA: dihydrolipoyl dehydrogenase, partial [Bacteroidota bacterium]|nr:dihydrolipoyl dehydrogenase [Bacteroidota bacterium]